MSYKKVLELPFAFVGSFEDWNKVRFEYTASCYCTAITTDMESYIEVEAMEQDCLHSLCEALVDLGFEYTEMEIERDRPQPRRKD